MCPEEFYFYLYGSSEELIRSHSNINSSYVMKPLLQIESGWRESARQLTWNLIFPASLSLQPLLGMFQSWAQTSSVTQPPPSHPSLWFGWGGASSSQLPEKRETPSFEYPIPSSRKFSLRINRGGESWSQFCSSDDTSERRSPATLCR